MTKEELTLFRRGVETLERIAALLEERARIATVTTAQPAEGELVDPKPRVPTVTVA